MSPPPVRRRGGRELRVAHAERGWEDERHDEERSACAEARAEPDPPMRRVRGQARGEHDGGGRQDDPVRKAVRDRVHVGERDEHRARERGDQARRRAAGSQKTRGREDRGERGHSRTAPRPGRFWVGEDTGDQPVADCEPLPFAFACGQLHHRGRVDPRRGAPRPEAPLDPQHAERAVEEHDVDREAHERRMDRRGRWRTTPSPGRSSRLPSRPRSRVCERSASAHVTRIRPSERSSASLRIALRVSGAPTVGRLAKGMVRLDPGPGIASVGRVFQVLRLAGARPCGGLPIDWTSQITGVMDARSGDKRRKPRPTGRDS